MDRGSTTKLRTSALTRVWARRGGLCGFVLGGLLSASACEADDPERTSLDGTEGAPAGPFLSCEPDEILPCTCANGASGEQTCEADGGSVSACRCADRPEPMPMSTTLPPGDAGGSDESTGSGSDTGSSTGADTGDASTGSSGGTTTR